MGSKDGLFVAVATIDPQVGEEVVLFMRDKAQTIEKLIALNFTGLMVKPGMMPTPYGRVPCVIFYFYHPEDAGTPLVSWIKSFNPDSKEAVTLLRRL